VAAVARCEPFRPLSKTAPRLFAGDSRRTAPCAAFRRPSLSAIFRVVPSSVPKPFSMSVNRAVLVPVATNPRKLRLSTLAFKSEVSSTSTPLTAPLSRNVRTPVRDTR
jgi:hypothetical protein